MLDIGANLENVRQRIRAAAQRAGRDPDEITLLAVSKRIDRARIEAGLQAGVRALGESRVQEAEEKIPAIEGETEWHFIGPLQGNKAGMAARLFDVIHSVRRASLVPRLAASAAAAGRTVRIYVQIEPSAEPTAAETVANAVAICHAVEQADGLQLDGLMTMAPYDPDPETARPYFASLRRLRDDVDATRRGLPPLGLSMGMSGDFEVAIEEGATIVRVGTAVFGERPY
jgi:pyridoxal phosphate enzyme (YggS family)